MNVKTTQLGLTNGRKLKLLLGFIALGFAASLAIYSWSGGFERVAVGPTIIMIVLIGPLTVLVVKGLRQGIKHLADLKAAWSWWHWMILLLLISTLVFRTRDNQEVSSTPVDALALLRIIPEVIVGIALFWRLKSRRLAWRESMFQGLIGLLTAFGLVAVASSTWSVYPAWTLYKSVEFILDVSVVAMFLISVTSEIEIRQLCNWVWLLYGLDLVITWTNAAIWPDECLDELGRLSSVWPVISYNSLGASSAIISVVALARLLVRDQGEQGRKERPWYCLLLACGLVTLAASQTRNAIAAFIVGAVLVLVFEHRAWIAGVMGGLGATLLIFTSLGPRVIQFLSRDQTDAQISALSGRGDWWAFAWQQFLQRPFRGYGAYAAGRFAVLGKLGIVAAQIHSDWMEVLTGTSFWGFLPFALAVIGCWWVLGRSYRDRSLTPNERRWLPEIAGVFGVLTLHSFFNVELSWHAPLAYLTVIAYAEYIRRERAKDESRTSEAGSVLYPINAAALGLEASPHSVTR
jgi:O-antigen ligase